MNLTTPTSCLPRRSRETGLFEDEDLEKEEELFEYVDDREYAKIVQRRQEEGFILDDGEGKVCTDRRKGTSCLLESNVATVAE